MKFCRNASANNDFTVKAICAQIKSKTKETKQIKFDFDHLVYATLDYKNNTHQGYFTIKSGQNDRYEAAVLVKYQNKTTIDVWPNSENSTCKQAGGVTTVFPPDIKNNINFETFSEDICRSIKLSFSEIQHVQDTKGYKFTATNNTFRSSEASSCFCLNKTADIDGIYRCFDGLLDLTTCQGAPVLVSFPHFLNADEKYVQGVIGVRPEKKLHETYVTLEPISGTPLSLSKRVQFNMFVRSVPNITSLENVTHTLMPIFWIDETTTLTGPYLDLLKHTLLRGLFIINVLRWTLMAIGLSMMFFSYILFFHFK
ncbi:sensory neuron membrane protein 1-like [Rhynchophorus ferrugineus]|uniref:sensory neuron membrane protein 1-like n=1 Tax=Rhynchophorus ferrugineus TaxID=354439 RepID=UPI003FCE8025